MPPQLSGEVADILEDALTKLSVLEDRVRALDWVNGIRAAHKLPPLAEFPPDDALGSRLAECPVARAIGLPGHSVGVGRLWVHEDEVPLPDYVYRTVTRFDDAADAAAEAEAQ